MTETNESPSAGAKVKPRFPTVREMLERAQDEDAGIVRRLAADIASARRRRSELANDMSRWNADLDAAREA